MFCRNIWQFNPCFKHDWILLYKLDVLNLWITLPLINNGVFSFSINLWHNKTILLTLSRRQGFSAQPERGAQCMTEWSEYCVQVCVSCGRRRGDAAAGTRPADSWAERTRLSHSVLPQRPAPRKCYLPTWLSQLHWLRVCSLQLPGVRHWQSFHWVCRSVYCLYVCLITNEYLYRRAWG